MSPLILAGMADLFARNGIVKMPQAVPLAKQG
jgi:hypothetical protein